MHIKTEHVLIILLLLPFGLRGVMSTPVIDYLMVLVPLAAVPTFLGYLYQRKKPSRIGKLAVTNQMLTLDDVSQILFCQKHSNERFGEIAIRRDFMTSRDVDALLEIQKSHYSHK